MEVVKMSIFSRNAWLNRVRVGKYWKETLWVSLVCSAVMLLLSLPAFGTPFFSENYQYMGQYRIEGEFLSTILLPTPDGWFKPVDKIVSILSHVLLPAVPLIFGLRNFLASILVLIVLHRFAVQITDDSFARILPVLYFTVSKIHLSMIGYYNLLGSILVSLFLLIGLLSLWIAYTEHKPWFAVAGYALLGLGIFTKEPGVVALPAMVGLLIAIPANPTKGQTRICWIIVRTIPVAGWVTLLFLARFFTTGHLLPVTPVYAPRFDLQVLTRNVVVFAGSLSNLSFIDPGATGFGSLSFLCQGYMPDTILWARYLDMGITLLVLLAFVLLVLHTRNRQKLAFPLWWAVASFIIFLTTRNLQIYYTYDLLLTASLVLMLTLENTTRRVRILAAAVVALIGLNGLISNRLSTYNWQYVAQHAGKVTANIQMRQNTVPIERITLVTEDLPFWRYTVGGMLIPEQMGDPSLKVDFSTTEDLNILISCNDQSLCYDLDNQKWIKP